MCVATTARRRRTQARNNYRHMAPRRRPHYGIPDLATAQRRRQKADDRRRDMAMRVGTKRKG